VDSYKVLARKYRPKSFEDLIGQDLLVKILKNAFEVDRIAHAFILTGIRGVGKTTTARIISSCLNCTGSDGKGGATITPCGVCDSCESISRGNHVDVLEIDAASRTGVGDIREIIDSVKYKPASARYKVFIIDEVHMLSNSAFNALLKTLEEPPEHTKFIFATTEIQKIPITVISRCQRYDLNRVSPDILIKFLQSILEKENKSLEQNALGLVVRASEGSVRDALSILDQIILQGDGAIKLEEIQEILGLSDRSKIIDLFELILQGDIRKSLDLLRLMLKNGGDPILILRELSEVTHWITSLKVAPDLSKDPLFTSFEKEKGSNIAKNIPLNILTRIWQVLVRSLEENSMYTNHFAHTEMAIIRLTTISNLPTPIEVVRDYKRLLNENSKEDPKKKELSDNVSVLQLDDKPQNETNAKDRGSSEIENKNFTPTNAILETTEKSEHIKESKPEHSERQIDNVGENCSQSVLLKKNLEEYEVLDLLRNNKEIPLLVEVENFVRFQACALGDLSIELKAGSSPNLISRFSKVLNEITGMSWDINLVENSGKKTAKEQKLETKELLEKKLMENDVVQSVLETFPGSTVFFDDKEDNVL